MKKNKYIIISLFAFFFLIVKSKVFAYSTSNFNPEYGITTSNVNLRKQARIEPSTILFSIQKDTIFPEWKTNGVKEFHSCRALTLRACSGRNWLGL